MVVLADNQAATQPAAEEPQPQPRRQRAVRTVETPQMEDADCGAACLSIILTHHGRRVPLAELRDRCGVGRDGMTASGFGRAAASYGLKVTGRWIDTSDLDMASRVPVPAVVLLDGRHYAVLEGVRRGRAWINDPAVGRLPLTPAEFAARANGPVLIAARTPEFEPGGDRWPFARAVAQRIRPYAPIILAGVLLGAVAALPTMLASMTMRAVLNRVLIFGDLAWRPTLLAILVGGVLLAALAGWAQQRIFATALAVMATRFSSRYLTALLRLPSEFFHRRHLSGLVNRTQMNDGLAIALSERIVLPTAAAVTVAGYGLLVGHLAPRLLVVMSMAMAAQIVLLNLVRRRAGPPQQRLLFEQLRRDSTAHSGLKMIESVKADGAERWLFAAWARSAGRTLDAANALASATLGVMALSAAIGPAALAGLALVGAHDVAAGRIDLGTLLTAQLVGGAMLAPLGLLVGLGSELQVTRVHISVIDDALAAKPHPARVSVLEPTAPPEPADPPRLSGRIEFDQVSFGYDRYRPPLVRDISFTAEPGQWIALVGASGSGKSTLARLAVGAAEPWSGAVLLDGRPRESYSRHTLAASIGYVEQQLRLFEGNLRDNLTLWDPTLPEERLRAALVDARINRLVEQRGGLDSGVVNEHARNLSGGEQQRLELARALAADPPLLVLDEATSALDATTEFAVLEALRRRGVTCMFIAHRISTVRDADLILVLDRGEIVQRGTHAELIDTDGVYRRLVTDGRSA